MLLAVGGRGRNQETPGECPYLTGEYAMAWIRGMQHGIEGTKHYRPGTIKIGATAKHWSNYGIENYGPFVNANADPRNGLPHSVPKYPPEGWKATDDQAAYCTGAEVESAGGGYCQFNRMTYSANVSARDRVETYWPAFRAAIEGANVSAVMCSYNSVTVGGDQAATISGGTPSCANANYLRNVLRDQWGFGDGLVVSDCQAIAIIKAGHGYRTKEDPHALPKNNSGVDLSD